VSEEETPGAVVLEYARAVDTRDWKLLASCFSPEAKVAGTLREDDVGPYLEFLQGSLESFSATMHVMSNQYIDVTGETATVETYAVAYHVATDSAGRAPTLTMGVIYSDELRREEGSWKIYRRRVMPKWVEGSLPS
jgi:hypothetical protein